MRDLRVIRAAVLTSLLAVAGCGGASTTSATPVAQAPVHTDPSAAPSPTAAVLRSAALRGANGHAASGTARILREGRAHVLELGSDFRIDGGSNDVYLTRAPGAPAEGDLNLGSLRALTGEQRYALADEAAPYGHVVLWCRPFRVPIGLGDLR